MSKTPEKPSANPYPGLRPFKEDEEHLFFGRENQVDAMVDKLAATRFLAVVGSSGSGKSSLVNCGLRPALRQGLMARAGTAWRMAQFRPGNNPIAAMARALAQDGVLFRERPVAALSLAEIVETSLRMSRLGLVDAFEQAALPAGVNLLVVVDQFEELFRYRHTAGAGADGRGDEAIAFVNLLLEARQHPERAIFVVMTMRSDFLGECTHFAGLAEAINAGQYLVPRMTRDERRAAIAGPAEVAQAHIAPVLLTRLVNDVGDNPDQLSILQHALNRTWASWETAGGTGAPGLAHYEAIGTMAQALDRHAEEACAELATPRQRRICEKLFKALTDKATDPRGVRRPTRLDLLCALADASPAEVSAVIEVFRQPSRSFLMPPTGEALADDTVIDISHESLMRVWQRLSGWADEEARSAQTCRRLAEAAALHLQGRASLWRDPELQLALDWRDQEQPNAAWAGRYGPGWPAAVKFLADSSAAREAERGLEEALRQSELQRAGAKADAQAQARSARRMRWAALAGAGLAVLALGFGVMALRARQAAEAYRLALASTQATSEGNATLGALLALRAVPRSWQSEVPEVWTALDRSLSALHERSILLGHGNRVTSAVFSHDGQRVLTASWDGSARVWTLAGGQAPVVLQTQGQRLSSAAFDPDGRRVVTASEDGSVLVWDLASGAKLARLDAGPARRASFSPDGRLVASAHEDGTTRLWDWQASPARAPMVLGDGGKAVNSAAFSVDGRLLVTAAEDKQVCVWALDSGAKQNCLEGGKNGDAAFSPDGRHVVATVGNEALVWDWESGEQVALLRGHGNRVTSAAFSPDGSRVVTASRDRSARLWDAASGVEIDAFKGHDDRLYSAAFSADGKQVVTSSKDRTARVWRVDSGSTLLIVGGGAKTVSSAAFSPDGTSLLTASGTAARLWDAVTGLVVADFETDAGGAATDKRPKVRSAALDADGRRVVVGRDDGQLSVWQVADRRQLLAIDTGHNEVNSVSFSPDGSQVLTAGNDGRAQVWRLADGSRVAALDPHPDAASGIATYSPDGEDQVTTEIMHAAFSADGRQVVTASEDYTARIWTPADGRSLVLVGHRGAVNDAAFSPDGKRVVTASLDDTAAVWDAASGLRLTVLRGHQGRVYAAAFSADGRRIVTGSEDRSVRLWDTASGRPLSVLTGHLDRVVGVAFGRDGKRVLSASKDGTARLWSVLPSGQELVDRARRELPRQALSADELQRFALEPGN